MMNQDNNLNGVGANINVDVGVDVDVEELLKKI